MFNVFPELIQHADPIDSNTKHTLFFARSGDVAHRKLLLNLRRLPEWMLSYCLYTAKLGKYPEYEPMPMLSPRVMSEMGLADQHLSWFTDQGRFQIYYWLRTEYLAEDFLNIIGQFTEVTPDQQLAVRAVGSVNALNYDRQISSWFSKKQVLRMYEQNPQWAQVERAIYEEPYIRDAMWA